MQTRFKDGSVMVVGGCSKDAQIEHVGKDNKPVCKVGLAVGKREDGSTIWVNVVGWYEAAAVLSEAEKGQQVLAIGSLKEREYNGKTYTDLVADFVSVCSPSGKDAYHPSYAPPAGDFAELTDDPSGLPF